MNFYRVRAIILRHSKILKHDINKILMIFFWPLLDIIIWGFVGLWVQKIQNSSDMQIVFLLTILLWQITNRVGQEAALSLLEEIWTDNLLNLFGSPLKITEWLVGALSFACLLGISIITYCTILIHIIYSTPLITIMWNFLIFSIPLFICGIWLGLLTLSVVLLLGKKGNELAFVTGWLMAPFCAVFYPKEILPMWAQKIGSFLPPSYVFESLRNYILQGVNPINNIIFSIGLSIIYIFITLILFFYLFKKSKVKGLKRLLD